MTSREDFDENDWEMLVFSPAFAAYGVAACDGRIDEREKDAVTNILNSIREKYPQNGLICAVLDELPGMIEDMTVPGELRYVKTRDELLWAYRKIGRILDEAPDPGEPGEFKSFLVDIVDQVAHSPGRGLKVIGKEFSEEEAGFLADVRNSLGMS